MNTIDPSTLSPVSDWMQRKLEELAIATVERDMLRMRVQKHEQLNRDMVTGLNEALATLEKLEAMK
jgi:hypothetical protein